MSVDFRLALQGSLRKTIEADEERIATGVTAGITRGTDHLKQRLRDQITGANLGPRLANSVRSVVYPQRDVSMSAAGSVYSKKSGHILAGWNEGSLIRPKDGKTYLAIPTENVPPRRRAGGFGSRGYYANPHEVETRFNQDLKFFKPPGSAVVLAYVDAIKSKSKRGGWRPVTKGRVKQGREAERVIMFVLIRQARLRKVLNIEGAQRDAASGLPLLIAQEVDRALETPTP